MTGILILIAVAMGVARLVNATTVEVTNEDGSTQRVANSDIESVSSNVSLDKRTGEPLITTGVTLSSADVTEIAAWILRQPDYAPACALAEQEPETVIGYLMEDVRIGVAGNDNTLNPSSLRGGVESALGRACP